MWMNIKVDRAFGLQISGGKIFIACSEGVMRVFQAETLVHVVTMARPPPLGETNILTGVSKIKIPTSNKSKFADIICCVVDKVNERLLTLYSDRMMFLWEIKDY